MKTFLNLTLALLFILASSAVAWGQSPQISSVLYDPVAPGANECLYGAGFGSTQGTVTVNGTAVTAWGWNDTSLCLALPTNLALGTATVQVTNANGSGSLSFVVVAAPTITSVTPASAVAGMQITITGSGFGSSQGDGYVAWHQSPATYPTIVSWSDAQIVVMIPATAAAGTNQLLVYAHGTYVSAYFTVVGPPRISSLQYDPVVAGTDDCVFGTGFGSVPGTARVNGSAVTVYGWGDTYACITLPASLPLEAATVQVTNAAGSDSLNFTVGAPPTITGVSPSSAAAGTQITISGTGFGSSQNGSYVAWYQRPVTYPTIVSWSDTQIVATIPATAAAGTNLLYVFAEGTDAFIYPFTVLGRPQISSVSPTTGPVGTQVIISGSGFGSTQGSGGATIGTTNMLVVNWSDTAIVAAMPTGAATGNVVVTTNVGQSSNAVAFAVTFPLLQLSISDTPLNVNLTSAQNIDWVHWGRLSATTPDRKAGASSQISDYSSLTSAPLITNSGVAGFSWSDGDHAQLVSETTSGVQISTDGGGFQITVPADTTAKTLNLYLEVFSGTGILRASLSDGSAQAITDQSVTDLDFGSKVYSIDFRAASAGQTLTVSFSAGPGARVGLQAATLTAHLPTVSIGSPAQGQQFTAPATVPVNISTAQFDSFISDIKAVGSDGTVLDNPSSSLNLNWGPLPGGHYSLAATASDTTALSGTSNQVELDVISQGGSLSIQESAPSSSIDLDNQGSADWILWGPFTNGNSLIENPGHILAHKAGVRSLISEYKPIGNHFIASTASSHNICFTTAQQSYCSGSQLAVHGQGNGYEISVAADTTPRTLQLYAGVALADAKVVAFLSDGSAPIAIETGGSGPPPNPERTTLYTISYKAASAGQTLTVRLTVNTDQGGGQIALIGAALNGSAVLSQLPQITALNPNSSPVNTAVTVVGRNFGASQANSSVYFGPVLAEIVSWSDTAIVALVPNTLSDGANAPIGVVTSLGISNFVSFATPSFRVIPASVKLVVGQVQSLQAADSAGNSIFGLQWTSSDSTVVQLSASDPPSALAIGSGTAVVYAGDIAVPVNVSATAPALVSINISPQNAQIPVGLSQQLTATGTYADGTVRDLTSVVTWSSQTPSIATVINSFGSVSGGQVGTATIQASFDSASAAVNLIVQSPALKSLVITPATPGTIVGGTLQFSAKGLYTDGSTQDITPFVTWNSSSSAIASINANGLVTGVSSGRAIITGSVGAISNFVTLVVQTASTPPSISAVLSQLPNGAGWNHAGLTIEFECRAGSAPIASCPASQTVTSEGAGQTFSGTATDSLGNSTSTSVTVNVDITKPMLAVSSPADEAVLTNPNLTVTGTASDSLSGLSSITCNGINAAISGGSFSCDVTFHPGVNLLLVRASDAAGNIAVSVMHTTVATLFPAPNSLQITPSAVNMLLGDTQQLTAVDENGRARNDANWTVSDNSLATITTDSSPVLTATGIGQVTVTANVGAISAKAQVNILFGTLLPVGTPSWSNLASSGFSPSAMFRAQNLGGGPDFYSLESDSSGTLNVRGLTGNGQQLWSQQLVTSQSGQLLSGAGDPNGGFLLVRRSATQGIGSEDMTAFDARTGDVLWAHHFAGLVPSDLTRPAIADDGTIYFWEQSGGAGDFKAYLIALDGMSGNERARYPVSTGVSTTADGSAPQRTISVSNPVIDGDGAIWAPYTTINTVSGAGGDPSFNETLSVLRIANGAAGSIPINTASGNALHGPFASPNELIPNGQGGVLVSWQSNTFEPTGNFIYRISNVSAGGSADFIFPSAMPFMMLGNDGTAFAANSTGITALNVNSGSVLWTYSQPLLNLLAATPAGGVILNQPGAGLVTLDPSGTLIASSGTDVASALPFSLTGWGGIVMQNFQVFSGPTGDFAQNEYQFQSGSPQGNRHRERPHPVNYRVLKATPENNGVFPQVNEIDAWDSSSGRPVDLLGCRIREHVTYKGPGSNASCSGNPQMTCFFPISPPWPRSSTRGAGFPNPTDVAINALSAIPQEILDTIPGAKSPQLGAPDKHATDNVSFVQPYSKSSFVGTQVHQWQCDPMEANQWVDLSKPFTITRELKQNSSGQWITVVTKKGPGVNVSDTSLLLTQP